MNNGNLKYQFARLSIAEKLIVINLAVFIVFGLAGFLLNLPGRSLEQWFELPKDFFDFLVQPWSLVTYSFLHGGLFHIFFNMLMLYYVGRIFLNFYGPRRFINVYFLGVILGGAFFLAAYNIFPVFYQSQSPLIGASAGVMAVLIFVCTYLPQQEVRLFFFNLKLWYIGAFFVLLDLVLIPTGDNPGGRIAHLGGALLGYLYARRSAQGGDLGAGFSRMLDWFAGLFEKRERKAPLKTVYRKQAGRKAKKVDYDKEARQRKIDTILDKISKSGYESLTQAEKDFLFKAGKED
ncbi:MULTISPECIES: rhomboid family protein [Robiginitalea]|uniref:Putative transmembrane rhomboid family protein n=1 Tax=Robiginitalea biformata (strain ATCC BAA-864 / DSM 15991 / KCTC 12146 / HTCC2501) TaxID=313596 RepID=A4CQ05_ROBBH|nr:MULTISPECIES: rhomboid family intramembrane serine protease [Robiginitalea]EAR14090.1 putative transmembrane rhomboid family protein [Robiginitalea biformata HTCC2501]MDC6354821.1 rhomboid family intramembrane serine protease [Robiginitalea sp. PM2]MDC6375087.1 rhomboid family intramembrane serine protease [Robiginitalea sp. SP8]